jgi:hypothetical protein
MWRPRESGDPGFLLFVMPGLDPGIRLDRRVKPGDDDKN